MQTYQVQEIYRKHGLTIALVSHINIDVYSLQKKSANAYLARIEPAWIVICETPTPRALNMQAERVNLDELREVIPELSDFLRQIDY